MYMFYMFSSQGLPWKFDADLFALGSCIYFTLHGTYLKLCRDERGLRTPTGDSFVSASSRWRPTKKCKRWVIGSQGVSPDRALERCISFSQVPCPCCAAAFGGRCRVFSAKGFPPSYAVEANMQIGRCREDGRASDSSHMVYL